MDPATGLVRGDRKYSAHRDTVENRSNAFGNTMVALLAKTLAETGWLDSPLERHFDGDYGRLLLDRFWAATTSATRSATRRSRAKRTSGRSTPASSPTPVIAPALGYLDREGFCDPYPLRYETVRRPEREVWLTRHVLPDYQGSTVWTSLGAMYLQVLERSTPCSPPRRPAATSS